MICSHLEHAGLFSIMRTNVVAVEYSVITLFIICKFLLALGPPDLHHPQGIRATQECACEQMLLLLLLFLFSFWRSERLQRSSNTVLR